MHAALSRPELISLAAGFVDQATLPVDAVRQATEHVLSDPEAARAALQYGGAAGDPQLREMLLARLAVADGFSAVERGLSIDRMIMTAGSNELLYLIGDSILDPGDIVLCAAPSYFVFLGALAGQGARSIGIAIDEGGIIPEALDETLRRLDEAGELSHVKAIYINSYFDNPSSITLAADRRAAVIEIAKRWSRHAKIYVVDDSVYRELRYSGEDVPSLLAADEAADTVIHTGSFSKSFSPGVRVGWGVLPTELVEPVLNQKGNIDFGSPNLSQQIMSAVLRLDLFDQHVARLRDSYGVKLEAMLGALDEHMSGIPGVAWRKAEGGLYVWFKTGGIDTDVNGPLFKRAMNEDVMYVPGVHCYPLEGEPAQTDMMRLSFGVQPPDRIRQGIAALAHAIREAT
jgi:2-aminoadipate transaminase